MSKGRVLIVTYVFPPEEGGVGMAAYEMACSLSSLDWDIHVLTRPLDSPDESFRSHPYSPLTTLPDTLTEDSARLREYLDGFLKEISGRMLLSTTPGRTGAGKNCWTRHGIQAFRFSSAPMVQLPISALFSASITLLSSA